jgi:hypothetical protein
LSFLLSLRGGLVQASGEARAHVPPGSRLLVEPFTGDKFSLQPRLETALLRYGYKLSSTRERADFV